MYNKFSDIYDNFIGIDYPEWISYIESIWAKFGAQPHLVLDLACGTGNFTIPLTAKGYDMIGIDNSAEMLSHAQDKASDTSEQPLFILQDMRSFELYGTVDACICMIDSINYILREDELLETFRLVRNYLNPGGLFVFDINTVYKFRHVLGDNSFSDISDDAAIVWENYYDEGTEINEYFVNIFTVRNDGLYERHEETHIQRAYEADFVRRSLIDSGLELLATYGALTFDVPSDESEKIFFVARKTV